MTLIALVLIAAWLGSRLLLLATSCREEVVSMKQFKFEITEVRIHKNDTVMVNLRFTNPSPMNIWISYISCEVRFNDNRVGVYTIDLHHIPITIGSLSVDSKEVPISIRKLREYEGKEIEVRVRGKVKIGTDYFSNVALEDTYAVQMMLHLWQLEDFIPAQSLV